MKHFDLFVLTVLVHSGLEFCKFAVQQCRFLYAVDLKIASVRTGDRNGYDLLCCKISYFIWVELRYCITDTLYFVYTVYLAICY